MKPDQLVARSLLGLVPQTMAEMTRWAHNSAQGPRNAIEPESSGGLGLVQYPVAHNRMIKLQQSAQKFETHRDPAYLYGSSHPVESGRDKVEVHNTAKSIYPSNLQSLVPGKTDRKVLDTGSSLPERRLKGIASAKSM